LPLFWRKRESTTKAMATADIMSKIWRELAAPSAPVFTRALRARGIAVRASDVREFISSKSERQILAPGPKFTGKITAFYRKDRWNADLINYTSRPVTREGITYAHVLFVQDLFTRFIYAKPMTTVTETAETFRKLLKKVKPPRQLDTDKGVEFRSNAFAEVCENHKILHKLKDAQDVNGLARMDNAMGRLKVITRKLQEEYGGDWLTHLKEATKVFNRTYHGATTAAPKKLQPNVVLEQHMTAGEGVKHNMKEIDSRRAKLEKLGGFRIAKDKTRGLKRRIDESNWSKRIYVVTSFHIQHPLPMKRATRTKPREFWPYHWIPRHKHQRPLQSRISCGPMRSKCARPCAVDHDHSRKQ